MSWIQKWSKKSRHKPRHALGRNTYSVFLWHAVSSTLGGAYTLPVAYRGGGVGVFKPLPPRNSEDTGGDLDRTSKTNRRLDFLL